MLESKKALTSCVGDYVRGNSTKGVFFVDVEYIFSGKQIKRDLVLPKCSGVQLRQLRFIIADLLLSFDFFKKKIY